MELLHATLLRLLLRLRTSPGSRASRSSYRVECAATWRRRGALQLPVPAGSQAGTRHIGRSQLTGWPCPRKGSIHLRLRKGALAERIASGHGRTRRLRLLGRHRFGRVVRRWRRRVRNTWRRARGSRVGHECVRAQCRFPAMLCHLNKSIEFPEPPGHRPVVRKSCLFWKPFTRFPRTTGPPPGGSQKLPFLETVHQNSPNHRVVTRWFAKAAFFGNLSVTKVEFPVLGSFLHRPLHKLCPLHKLQ